MQSEVSQKDKNKYEHRYIGNLEKMVLLKLFAGQEYRCRCKERSCGWGRGGRGEWDELGD